MTDGSSDLYGGKYLAVLVRFIDQEKLTIKTKLLNIIELGSVTTGEMLFNKIMKPIFEGEPSLKQNVVGLCTDNEAKMISSKNQGLANRLIEEIPHLVHVRDIPHCYNLIYR